MNRCNGVKRLSNNPVFCCDSVTGLVTMLTSPFTYTSDKFQWDGRKADSYAAPVDTENKVATIASAEEPALFKYEVTDQKVDYSGYTAEITKDIDLGSGFWRPIDPVNNLTINGNGHTIRNLLICTCTNTSGYDTAEFNTVQVTNSVIEGYGKIGCIRRMGADVNVTVTFKIAFPRTTPSARAAWTIPLSKAAPLKTSTWRFILGTPSKSFPASPPHISPTTGLTVPTWKES